MNEVKSLLATITVFAASIMLTFLTVYGGYSIYHRGELKREIIELKKELKFSQNDVNTLIDENNALRKIVTFENTLLPFFSDETKDKMLSTEGCLSLGG